MKTRGVIILVSHLNISSCLFGWSAILFSGFSGSQPVPGYTGPALRLLTLNCLPSPNSILAPRRMSL